MTPLTPSEKEQAARALADSAGWRTTHTNWLLVLAELQTELAKVGLQITKIKDDNTNTTTK